MKLNCYTLIGLSLLLATMPQENLLCAKEKKSAKPAGQKAPDKTPAKVPVKAHTVEELYAQCIQLVHQLNQQSTDAITRTGQANAIIVLQGLSQTCAHLGQIAGAQTKPEKQQGAFNILSTLFDTAARLTGPTNPLPPSAAPAPAQPQQQAANGQTSRAMLQLADQLATYMPDEQEYRGLAQSLPLIALIKKAKQGNLHKIFIKKMLQSSSPGKRFLKELLMAVNQYVMETLQTLKGPHLDRKDKTPEGKKKALLRLRALHGLDRAITQLMPELQENVMAHYNDVWNTTQIQR